MARSSDKTLVSFDDSSHACPFSAGDGIAPSLLSPASPVLWADHRVLPYAPPFSTHGYSLCSLLANYFFPRRESSFALEPPPCASSLRRFPSLPTSIQLSCFEAMCSLSDRQRLRPGLALPINPGFLHDFYWFLLSPEPVPPLFASWPPAQPAVKKIFLPGGSSRFP